MERDSNLRAFASITIDDSFVVHDLRVIEGSNGLFVVMPSKQLRNGEYWDIAHPIVNEARQIIQDAVLAAYREAEARDMG